MMGHESGPIPWGPTSMGLVLLLLSGLLLLAVGLAVRALGTESPAPGDAPADRPADEPAADEHERHVRHG